MASNDLIAQKERIQRQIETLERRLAPLGSISSASDLSEDDGSEDSALEPEGMVLEDLVAERERIQREIQELEHTLGPDVSCLEIQDEEAGDATDSSGEDGSEELDLPQNVGTCLQLNLVYQQVLEEKLAELEQLLKENREQQREVKAKTSSSAPPQPSSSSSFPLKLFLGNFMKPYFKDKLTGLGPPANSETRDKRNKGTRNCDDLKIRRWEGWQKTLLLKAVVNDTMKRLLQPKLSKLEYLTEKMSKASDMDKQILQKQIGEIEREIEDISAMKEEQLVGNCRDDHDWDKISNVDFEGTRNSDDMRRFWENYLHPSINKSCWKEDEIEKLRGIVKKYQCCHWDKIAEELGTNRTAFMCLQTYQNYISKELKKKMWTKEEDDVLRELVDKMRIGNYIPYTQISYFMEGREAGQLIYRWTQVLHPSLKKGHWTKEEDEMLLKAVAKYGARDWWKIRQEVPGRNDGQCRDRYLDCLRTDVKKGPWTAEEEALLIRMVEKYGAGRWAKISSEVPYRTDCQCLHKWRSLTGYTALLCRKYRKQKKMASMVQRRRPCSKRKKEPAEDESSEEEGEEQVVYMDTDEEIPEKHESDQESEIREKYVPTKIEEWVPKEVSQLCRIDVGALRNHLSSPPSRLGRARSEHSLISEQGAKEVLNTVLDRKGSPLEVIIGKESPAKPQQKNDSSENEMVRISASEARTLLHAKCTMFLHNRPMSGRVKQRGKKRGRVTQMKEGHRGAAKPCGCMASDQTKTHICTINNQLMQAVLPWMGNLLVPLSSRPNKRREADVVREKGESIGLQSTPVFKLFLKVFCIDAEGCKKVIEKRKKEHNSLVQGVEPPKPVLPPKLPKGGLKNRSVAQMLYEKRLEEYEKQVAGPKKSEASASAKTSGTVVIAQPLVQIVPFVNVEMGTGEGPPPGKRIRKPTGKALALKEEKASVKLKRACDPQAREEQMPSVSRPITWVMTVNGLVPVRGLDLPMTAPNQMAGISGGVGVGTAAVGLTRLVSAGCVVGAKRPELPLTVANVSVTPGISVLPRATLALPLVSSGLSGASSVGTAAVAVRPVCPISSSMAVKMHIPVQAGMVQSCHSNTMLSPQPCLPTATTAQTIGTSPACATLKTVPTSSALSFSVTKETTLTHPQCLPVLKVLHPHLPASSGDSAAQRHQAAVRVVASNASPPSLSLRPPAQQGHRPTGLSFDPNLMFLEEESQVREWIKGTNGVTLAHLDMALPYLPPFVGNLKALLGLLQRKEALEMRAMQLLPSSGEADSKEAQLDAMRKMVAEQLSENPAYLLLKARFLSCFTLPALVATVHPGSPNSPPLLSAESSEGEESAPPEKPADKEVELRLDQGAPLSSGGEQVGAAHFPRMSTRRRSRLLTKP